MRVTHIYMKQLLLIISLLYPVFTGITQEVPSTQEYKRILDKYFDSDAPGGAVLVVQKGKTLYKDAKGLADMELNLAIQPDMIFRIGSISKQFTAMSILKLHEEGKLNVQDKIQKYLPQLSWTETITIEQLVHHTSGVPSYTDFPDFMGSKSFLDTPLDSIIEYINHRPLDFAPGTEWNYSNSGYVLLGSIIEKVSGMSYEDYIERNLFAPLGMKNSRFEINSEIVPNKVNGYTPKDASGWSHAQYISMTWPHAAGSLLSTTEDLYIWTKALNDGKFVSKSSLEIGFKEALLANGENTHYAYGLNHGVIRGERTLEHSGGIPGFVTNACYLPDQDLFVAVLTNREADGPTALTAELIALTLGKPYSFNPTTLDEKTMKEYSGVYVSDDTKRFITYENGKLFSQREGSVVYELTPSAKDEFFFQDAVATISFKRNKKGKIESLIFDGSGQRPSTWNLSTEALPAPTTYKKVDEKLLLPLVGQYELMPGFIFTVSVKDGKLYGFATGQQEFELKALSETEFEVKEVGAKFTFVEDHSGIVSSMILFQGGQRIEGKRK
jgi:CubicO group peptidase (beta-lactamase class C family)